MTDKQPMTDKQRWWLDANPWFGAPPPPGSTPPSKEPVLLDKTYRNSSLNALGVLAGVLTVAGIVLLIIAFKTEAVGNGGYYTQPSAADIANATHRVIYLMATGILSLLVGGIALVARLVLTSQFTEQAAGNKWAAARDAANDQRAANRVAYGTNPFRY